ncbi:MAG TPA: hypothetical protein VEA78_11580 [Acidimicrobiales bacterium]|nr:hypothetical protein [Acidimicrobiales bacterium]
MDRYEIVATIAVVAMPFVVAGLVLGAVAWARDALARHTPAATIGILLTAAAVANLFVQRRLGRARTRPVMALFVEQGDAFRSALLALAVALLLAAATSVATRLPTR